MRYEGYFAAKALDKIDAKELNEATASARRIKEDRILEARRRVYLTTMEGLLGCAQRGEYEMTNYNIFAREDETFSPAVNDESFDWTVEQLKLKGFKVEIVNKVFGKIGYWSAEPTSVMTLNISWKDAN